MRGRRSRGVCPETLSSDENVTALTVSSAIKVSKSLKMSAISHPFPLFQGLSHLTKAASRTSIMSFLMRTGCVHAQLTPAENRQHNAIS